jgi:hypothetical protein
MCLLSSRHVWPLGELCWVYSLSDRIAEAQKILDELIARAKTEYISGLFLAGPAYYFQKIMTRHLNLWSWHLSNVIVHFLL